MSTKNANKKAPADGVLPAVDNAAANPAPAPTKVEPATPISLEKKPLPAADDKPANPMALKLPAKAAKKRQKIVVKTGEAAEIKVGDSVYTIKLPADITSDTIVSVASHNVGWVGREGDPLRAHICISDAGAVILTPQTDGTWKANTFGKNRISLG